MIRQAVKRLLKLRYLGIPVIDDVYKGFRPADLLVIYLRSDAPDLIFKLLDYKKHHPLHCYSLDISVFFLEHHWRRCNQPPSFEPSCLNVLLISPFYQGKNLFRQEAKRIFIFRYENKEYIQIGGVHQ